MSVWRRSFDEHGDMQRSVKDALMVVLTSPQFLFLIEHSESPDPELLSAHELASKLSYFLWNTSPDEELLRLAAEDTLHAVLDNQVGRMVRDDRLTAFADAFGSQWLSLDKFDVVEIDRKRFPHLTRDTKAALREEPARFLQYLIQHNLSVRHLIQSDFILANETVASYYSLAEQTESGFSFVPVMHQSPHLGGVLAQAAILAGLSDGREPNPVKRGAWLARKIVAEPPDDPPPNVPDLEEDTSHLPLRERLARHRNQPGCAKCHAGIDPWGVPLECFDAGGRFRDAKIDCSSILPDETAVTDFHDLRRYLAHQRLDQVAFSVLKHLSTYAVGRSLTYRELETLKRDLPSLRRDGYRMQDLLHYVVTSDLFLHK